MNLEEEMQAEIDNANNFYLEDMEMLLVPFDHAVKIAKQYAEEMCKKQNAINMEICLSYIELTILDKERAMGVNGRTKVLGDILNAPLATEKK